jgi:hypothetical protein
MSLVGVTMVRQQRRGPGLGPRVGEAAMCSGSANRSWAAAVNFHRGEKGL